MAEGPFHVDISTQYASFVKHYQVPLPYQLKIPASVASHPPGELMMHLPQKGCGLFKHPLKPRPLIGISI
jgi:hypothetical protein